MKINWIGGNLPQIGKSWMVRGLAESIFNKHRICPIVVDTSIGSKLSKVYNPQLLDFYDPSLYFTGDILAADGINELGENYQEIIVKLSNGSQTEFIKWLKNIDSLESEIRHHFWFVTNGHRNSIKYFNELHEILNPFLENSSKCRLSIVRNHHNLKWRDSQEIKNINTCNLSGIITNPQEIQYIEDNELILCKVASPTNAKVPLIFRSRLIRFLNECHDNFLPNESERVIQKEDEIELSPISSFDREEDEKMLY